MKTKTDNGMERLQRVCRHTIIVGSSAIKRKDNIIYCPICGKEFPVENNVKKM